MRLALVVIGLLVATASAQPNPQEEARAHFKQGKAYQEAGAFLRAAEEFKAAYALDARTEMLFDIAQAYRLGGDKPLAIEYFKRYLAAKPDGKAADEARVLVAELQRQVDEAQANRPPPTVPDQRPPPAERPRDMVQVRSSPTIIRIAGLAVAGVGGLALGLGVKYGLDARSASTYFTDFMGTWTDADRRRYADGEAANRDMKIAYVVGAGLITTGAVLYWWGSRMQAVPVGGPQTAGIALRGTF